MKARIARWLRKWADWFAPQKPLPAQFTATEHPFIPDGRYVRLPDLEPSAKSLFDPPAPKRKTHKRKPAAKKPTTRTRTKGK